MRSCEGLGACWDVVNGKREATVDGLSMDERMRDREIMDDELH